MKTTKYLIAVCSIMTSFFVCQGQVDTSFIIELYDTIQVTEIDEDEAEETEMEFGDQYQEEFPDDFDFGKMSGPHCPNTSGCEIPEAKDLAFKFIKVKEGCHYSGSSCYWGPFGMKTIKSDPPYRVLRFSALFHKSAIYQLDEVTDQPDWNKMVTVYSTQCTGTQYSVRLGWRSRYAGDGITPPVSENLIEYALYSHLDHRNDANCKDGIKGREAVRIPGVFTTEAFLTPTSTSGVAYGGWPTELVLYERGVFVRVGSKGVAIRRDFTQMPSPICEPAKTRIRKSVYFGGDQDAPHDMFFKLTNMKLDYSPTWWTASTYKGFCRSEWYSDDVQTIVANERIELNLPLDFTQPGGPQDNFIKFHAGTDITFITPDLVPDLSMGGFPAGSGIDVEVGAEVEHIIGTTGINTGEVFNYTCPGNGKKGDDDNNDYFTETVNEEKSAIETQPIDINTTTSFSLHPNPSSGRFTVEWRGSGSGELSIRNLFGQEVYRDRITAGSTGIDLSGQAAGMYFVRLRTREGNLIKKLLIR